MKRIDTKRSRDAARWLRQEGAEQQRRYRRIAATQTALAPKRERWLAAFLERIQSRGVDVAAGEPRRVRPDELPARPRRKLRVVY